MRIERKILPADTYTRKSYFMFTTLIQCRKHKSHTSPNQWQCVAVVDDAAACTQPPHSLTHSIFIMIFHDFPWTTERCGITPTQCALITQFYQSARKIRYTYAFISSPKDDFYLNCVLFFFAFGCTVPCSFAILLGILSLTSSTEIVFICVSLCEYGRLFAFFHKKRSLSKHSVENTIQNFRRWLPGDTYIPHIQDFTFFLEIIAADLTLFHIL